MNDRFINLLTKRINSQIEEFEKHISIFKKDMQFNLEMSKNPKYCDCTINRMLELIAAGESTFDTANRSNADYVKVVLAGDCGFNTILIMDKKSMDERGDLKYTCPGCSRGLRLV